MATRPASSLQERAAVSINVDIVHESDTAPRSTRAHAAPIAAAASGPENDITVNREDLDPPHITSVDQETPFFVRQHDVLDDGLPPLPRSGWPTKQMDCYVRLFALSHLPRSSGPVSGRSHFSVELSLGESVYKNLPCPGDVDQGCVLDQVHHRCPRPCPFPPRQRAVGPRNFPREARAQCARPIWRICSPKIPHSTPLVTCGSAQ